MPTRAIESPAPHPLGGHRVRLEQEQVVLAEPEDLVDCWELPQQLVPVLRLVPQQLMMMVHPLRN